MKITYRGSVVVKHWLWSKSRVRMPALPVTGGDTLDVYLTSMGLVSSFLK